MSTRRLKERGKGTYGVVLAAAKLKDADDGIVVILGALSKRKDAVFGHSNQALRELHLP